LKCMPYSAQILWKLEALICPWPCSKLLWVLALVWSCQHVQYILSITRKCTGSCHHLVFYTVSVLYTTPECILFSLKKCIKKLTTVMMCSPPCFTNTIHLTHSLLRGPSRYVLTVPNFSLPRPRVSFPSTSLSNKP